MLCLLLNFIITSLPLFLNQYFPCINFTVTENGVNSNIFSVSRKKAARIYGQLFWRYLQFSPFLSDSLIPCDLGIDVGIVGKSWFVSSVQEHKLAGLFAVNSFGYILNLLTQRCEVCLLLLLQNIFCLYYHSGRLPVLFADFPSGTEDILYYR